MNTNDYDHKTADYEEDIDEEKEQRLFEEKMKEEKRLLDERLQKGRIGKFKKFLEAKKYTYPPNILDDVVAKDQECRIVLGDVQSGKTSYMKIYSLANLVMHKGANIIVVMNGEKHGEQILNGCTETSSDYKKFLKIQAGDEYPIVQAGGPLSEKKKKKIKKILEKGNGTIICLGNGAQLSTVNGLIKMMMRRGKTPHFDLFVDEADDYFDKPETTLYYTEFQKLKQIAWKKFCVTATAVPLLFSPDEFSSKYISRIPRDPDYIGISDLEFVELPHRARVSAKKKTDNYFEADPYSIEHYIELGREEPFQTQPIISLLNVSRFKLHHSEFIKMFSTHPELKEVWTVLTLNGDGIYLYSPFLRGEKITIEEKGSVLYEGQEIDIDTTDACTDTGVHIFEDAPLRSVLGYLRDRWSPYPYAARYPMNHILIVSGDMASRGLNFVDSSYHWHLSHMYYMSKNSKSKNEQVIQAMRCCGVFRHDGERKIIPKVYSLKEDINKIQAAYRFQQRVFDEMLGKKEDVVMNEEVTKIPQPSSDLKKLGQFGRRKNPKFNWVKDKDLPAALAEYRGEDSEDEDDGDEEEKKTDCFLVDEDQPNPARKTLYMDVVEYFVRNGIFDTWVPMTTIVSVDERYKMLWNMIKKKQTKVSDDSKGLLVKSINGTWNVKYDE